MTPTPVEAVSTNLRLEYARYGGADEVHLDAFRPARPGRGEVLVRVKAASANPMDWKTRRGDFKLLTGWRFPRAMGADFAGIVEKVGANVAGFKEGDAVLGTVPMRSSGAFATRLVTRATLIARKPEVLSWEQASTLPVVGIAAWCALVRSARLPRGGRVFVNGAMGGVGLAAVAIARALECEVVGRVGPAAVALGPSIGLSRTLDYTKDVPRDLDGSFDVVFDTQGSLTPEQQARLAGATGRIADLEPSARKFMLALVSRRRGIVFADLKASNLQEVVDLAARGQLELPIARVCSLQEAPQALSSLEHGSRPIGKLVILP